MNIIHDMYIENHSYDINFKAGLNYRILCKEKFINTKSQEKFFADFYGTEASFSNNKSAALANKLCSKIFEQLQLSIPPAISIYKKENLIDNSSADNFCIPDTKKVLKNDFPFIGGSIFFKDFKNLQLIDSVSEQSFSNKKTSSPHFLAPFIHEWIHSYQINCIYKSNGYGGPCKCLNSLHPQKADTNGYEIIKSLESKRFSEKENEVIFNILGEYSTHGPYQYLEVFSETLTKFICSSLKSGVLCTNPFDMLKNISKEFMKIFQKSAIIPLNNRTVGGILDCSRILR